MKKIVIGKVPTIQKRPENDGGGDDVVGQLNNMREQLERKEEEHGDVWNGLVEV